MNRRTFVRRASAAVLVGSAAGRRRMMAEDVAASGGASPAQPVRVGIIGPGSRGKELLRNMLRVPGVKIQAAADVYEPRFREVNTLCGYSVAAHKDYRELLDRKDLDAIVVATPLSMHAEHVVAALQSDRHVYGEKTLAFTVPQAQQIVRAAQSSKHVFQVGHQYRYAAWIRTAIDRVSKGEIGDVTHVYGYWHRNSDWRRPVPNASMDRLLNWRLYNEYSLGLLAELGSHQIDIANWIFGEAPQAALASGSVAVYHDGRENDDNVQAILSYSNGRRFVFSSITNNAKEGDQLWVYGTRGSLNLTLQDAEFYYEPKRSTPTVVDAKTQARGIATGASYRSGGEMPYRGPGKKLDVAVVEDPTATACRSFIDCVRTGKQPISDAQVGLRSAVGVIAANKSLKTRAEVKIEAV